MTPKQDFLLKAFLVGLVSLAASAAFSAYLKPGMLVEFANLVLCS
jgi:hypothetical protein